MTSSGADRVAACFKAYDVRGRTDVPGGLDDAFAYAVGWAFAQVSGAAEAAGAVAVGHDMRTSSPDLAAALGDGLVAAGADVVDIGLASTDLLYFASGRLDVPGVMVTASHNPAGWNGFKLCLSQARPVGRDTGLSDVADLTARALDAGRTPPLHAPPRPRSKGDRQRLDVLSLYAEHLHRLVPVRGRRLRVVVDAGNGMAGHTVPAVFADLDVELVPLYFELDGTFPHHEANPLDHETLVDLQEAVVRHGADLGLAFDGDADRCFVIDERGRVVDPSGLTALIAARELIREPGAVIIHNLICSRAVPEIVIKRGGHPVRTPVGHSLIKAEMAAQSAIFGGEHSGHFYFRDFWYADSGMMAALHVLASAAETDDTVSVLLSGYRRYRRSGEINSVVGDPLAVMGAVESAYAGASDVAVDHLDGVTVSHPDWWFNVRPSNTEPVLRLNVEGRDDATMARVRDDVLDRIRRHG